MTETDELRARVDELTAANRALEAELRLARGEVRTVLNNTEEAKLKAEREYEKYITGVNTQNSNYLAAVQAAMGQQTTGQQTSVGQQTTTGESTATGNVNTQMQSGGESVQVTKVGGGSGSGSTSDKLKVNVYK